MTRGGTIRANSDYSGFCVIIVHGVYHFFPEKLAFRNDYCLTCRSVRTAVQVRTFDVGHIFWIPILPVGFWKRWHCVVCNNDPHATPGTRRVFKWLGLFVLLVFSAAFWTIPVEPDIQVLSWAIRIGAPIGALLTLIYLLRTPPDPSLQELLKTVPPTEDSSCPFCHIPLMVGDRTYCPQCLVMRI